MEDNGGPRGNLPEAGSRLYLDVGDGYTGGNIGNDVPAVHVGFVWFTILQFQQKWV